MRKLGNSEFMSKPTEFYNLARVAVREYRAPSALVEAFCGICGIRVAAISAIIRSRLRKQATAEGAVDWIF